MFIYEGGFNKIFNGGVSVTGPVRRSLVHPDSQEDWCNKLSQEYILTK